MALACGGHGVGRLLQPAQTRPRQIEVRSTRIVISVIQSIHREVRDSDRLRTAMLREMNFEHVYGESLLTDPAAVRRGCVPAARLSASYEGRGEGARGHSPRWRKGRPRWAPERQTGCSRRKTP